MNYWEQYALLQDEITCLEWKKFECSDPSMKEKYDNVTEKKHNELRNIEQMDIFNRDYYCYKDFGRLLDYYINKAYSDGLFINDYKEIYRIVMELKRLKVCNYVDELDDIINTFSKLLESMRNCGINDNLHNFLMNEGSILHLVRTNNKTKKIKISSYDGYMFLCDFHEEVTPSMEVYNYTNRVFCYGCGFSSDLISYLMNYERLDYATTLLLLAKVYMIDLRKNNLKDNNPLVKKYQESLLSDSYRELLIKGKERLQKYQIGDRLHYEYNAAMNKFDHDLMLIERIRNGEHIEYKKKREKVFKLTLN